MFALLNGLGYDTVMVLVALEKAQFKMYMTLWAEEKREQYVSKFYTHSNLLMKISS